MKKDNLMNDKIKTLVDRYSKIDVISNIEKNYSNESIRYVNIENIKDNRYLKDVLIPTNEINTLVKSINENNLYTPLIVRSIEHNKHEIILGRKRFLAAKKANLKTIPVIVNEYTDEEVLFALLADTKDRKHVSAYETAIILNKLKTEYDCSNKILAEFLEQSESQISNLIALLKLPKHILDDLSLENIGYGHARCLAYLEDENEIKALYEKIKTDDLSVRETEQIIANKLKTNVNSKVFVSNNEIKIKFDNEKEKEELIELISNYFKNKQ